MVSLEALDGFSFEFDKGIYGASPKIYDYMRYVIYDRKKREVKNIDNHKNLNIENHINIKEEITMNYSAPNYISYYPRLENKKFVDKEPIWIMPHLKHNFNWEKNK